MLMFSNTIGIWLRNSIAAAIDLRFDSPDYLNH
jgi:hypothetical protein